MTGVRIYDPARSSREYRHCDPRTGLIVPDAPSVPTTVPDVRYSMTTSRHQSIARRAHES